MSKTEKRDKINSSSLENNTRPLKKESNQTYNIPKENKILASRSLALKMTGFMSIFFAIFYLVFKNGQVSSHSEDSNSSNPDSPKKVVTYNSLVKLNHAETNFRLHSQEAKYGTGSGQQVVSCHPDSEETDTMWLVNDAFGVPLSPAGTPISCGSSVSFQHLATKHHLHSHYHESPLSSQQEVSGFKNHDSGDNWKIICLDSKGKEITSGFWIRGDNVLIQHEDTLNYLASSKKYKYPSPIAGQLEVFASTKGSSEARWHTKEGFYFPAPEENSDSEIQDEQDEL